MNSTIISVLSFFSVISVITVSVCIPIISEENAGYDSFEESNSSVNDTSKNLYVIKAVVYEIGILTDSNDNDTDFESQERVDLSFFDTHTNETHIDLGTIPFPIQTNVSGQVLTGVAPINLGAVSNPSDLLASIPLTGNIINITHSDTAYYELKKTDLNSNEAPVVLNNSEIGISNVIDLFPTSSPLETQSDLSPQKISSPFVPKEKIIS